MSGAMAVASPERASFRQAMRRMASTVSIIAAEHGGQRGGLAATSLTSVSADPPTVLVCINHSASAFALVRAAGQFSANMLGCDQRAIGDGFGGQGPREERFARGQWVHDDTGTPYLLATQATLICRVVEELPYATHTIFLAEVVRTLVSEHVDPLLYADGRYGSVQLEVA
ncbi:flavin reductase family protein [Hydrogenophaga sp. BPS33]|uniref:flavin reductase family protein n=1 Tax=Hydrogenophaga sp. BPS33 TaxID=2651974 RepID=UPI00131F4C44|nr:flavin reductase family protein [Hydrogenophaga sp. BPS33]QHE83515.1 flavin reductase [Hydrogenophaga sp. BPS33]